MAEPIAGSLSRKKSRRKKRRLSSDTGKFLLIALLLLAVSFVVYAVVIIVKGNHTLDKISAPNRSPTVTDDVYGDVVESNDAESDVTNILLLGTDNRPATGSLNTDVIMIVSLRPEPRQAVIVSIPRDTYMDPEGWRPAKANSFYASARRYDKEGAYDMVRKIYSEFVDVPIDYVVEINFKAFEDIVDALGGITVDVDMNMRYVDPTDGTDINLLKGEQLLNGKQALDFIRYRQRNDGTGISSDMQRNARQQQVVSRIVEKVKSYETIIRAGGLLDAVGNNVKTSIPRDEMIKLLRTYAGISNDNIEYIRLEGVWKSPYVWPNEDSLKEIRQKLKEQMTIDHSSES